MVVPLARQRCRPHAISFSLGVGDPCVGVPSGAWWSVLVNVLKIWLSIGMRT